MLNQILVFWSGALLILLAGTQLAGGPRLMTREIPVVENPEFIPAAAADFLEDNELVLGVVREGQAKAYPIRILGLYEVINDQVGDTGITATW